MESIIPKMKTLQCVTITNSSFTWYSTSHYYGANNTYNGYIPNGATFKSAIARGMNGIYPILSAASNKPRVQGLSDGAIRTTEFDFAVDIFYEI